MQRPFRPFRPVTRVPPRQLVSQRVTSGIFDHNAAVDEYLDDEVDTEPRRAAQSPLSNRATTPLDDELPAEQQEEALASECLTQAVQSSELEQDMDLAISESLDGLDDEQVTPTLSQDSAHLPETGGFDQDIDFAVSDEPQQGFEVQIPQQESYSVDNDEQYMIESSHDDWHHDSDANDPEPSHARSEWVPSEKLEQIRDRQQYLCPVCEVDWSDDTERSQRTKKAKFNWIRCTLPGFPAHWYIDEKCHNSWNHEDGLGKAYFGDNAIGAAAFIRYKRESAKKGSYTALREHKASAIAAAQGSSDCPTCPSSKAGQTVDRWCDCTVPGLRTVPGFQKVCRPCYQSWYTASRKPGNVLVNARAWCRQRNARCREVADNRVNLWL